MGKKPTKVKTKFKTNKLALWFKYFTDENNLLTFLNKTASAKAAGYKCTTDESFRNVGLQNFTKLDEQISKWTDEVGLSESRLKLKLTDLTEAKETKFFQKDGKVTDQRDVEALGIQIKAVELAGRWKGMDKVAEGTGMTINIYPPGINKPKEAGV